MAAFPMTPPRGRVRLFGVIIRAAVVLAVVVPAFAQKVSPVNGNVRSRVYHFSRCVNYDCPNCTARFASAAEAERAGYRRHRSNACRSE